MPSEITTVASVCVLSSVDVEVCGGEVKCVEVEVEVEVEVDLQMGVKGSHLCDDGGMVFAFPLGWLVLARLEAG